LNFSICKSESEDIGNDWWKVSNDVAIPINNIIGSSSLYPLF